MRHSRTVVRFLASDSPRIGILATSKVLDMLNSLILRVQIRLLKWRGRMCWIDPSVLIMPMTAEIVLVEVHAVVAGVAVVVDVGDTWVEEVMVDEVGVAAGEVVVVAAVVEMAAEVVGAAGQVSMQRRRVVLLLFQAKR